MYVNESKLDSPSIIKLVAVSVIIAGVTTTSSISVHPKGRPQILPVAQPKGTNQSILGSETRVDSILAIELRQHMQGSGSRRTHHCRTLKSPVLL